MVIATSRVRATRVMVSTTHVSPRPRDNDQRQNEDRTQNQPSKHHTSLLPATLLVRHLLRIRASELQFYAPLETPDSA